MIETIGSLRESRGIIEQLQLFTVFHLNLSYSSIEEEQRLEVIKRCYWPLLRLVREYNLPRSLNSGCIYFASASAYLGS